MPSSTLWMFETAVHVASGGEGGVEVDGVGAGTTVTMATVLRGGGGSVVVVKVIVVESAGEGKEGAREVSASWPYF